MTIPATVPSPAGRGTDSGRHGPLPTSHSPRIDYSRWSVEELRAFALQMQLPDAATRTRRELLEIFTHPAAAG